MIIMIKKHYLFNSFSPIVSSPQWFIDVFNLFLSFEFINGRFLSGLDPIFFLFTLARTKTISIEVLLTRISPLVWWFSFYLLLLHFFSLVILCIVSFSFIPCILRALIFLTNVLFLLLIVTILSWKHGHVKVISFFMFFGDFLVECFSILLDRKFSIIIDWDLNHTFVADLFGRIMKFLHEWVG